MATPYSQKSPVESATEPATAVESAVVAIPKTQGEALLAFFSPEGVEESLARAGITGEELYRIIGDIARNGKTDQGRLSAIDMIFKRAEFALRLGRVFGTETTRVLAIEGRGAPLSLSFTEEERLRLTDSARRTEEALSRSLSGGARTLPQLPEGPTIDVVSEDIP